jgi:hypothetical protein
MVAALKYWTPTGRMSAHTHNLVGILDSQNTDTFTVMLLYAILSSIGNIPGYIHIGRCLYSFHIMLNVISITEVKVRLE